MLKMALQQNRILRFLMILTAILLTIFIYASYYSNTVMTLPGRLHASAASSSVLVDTSVRDNNVVDYSIIVLDKQNSGKVLPQSANINVELNKSIGARPFFEENPLPSLAAGPSAIADTAHNGSRKSPVVAAMVSANATAVNSLFLPVKLNVLKTTTAVRLPSVKAKPKAPSVSTSTIRNDPLKGVRTKDIYEGGHQYVNPQLCPDEGKPLKLLILITSAPKNQEARLAIRQTWGHYAARRDVAIGFVLGRTTLQQIEDSLTAENYMYSDLIRGHFIDSYNNLTLKTISILEWIDQNCPKAEFTLKTDDDMFINVAKLLSFIKKHQNDKRTIYGRLAKEWRPIRNQKSKYYVSPGQFQSIVFPQFTTGPAYLMTADTIHDLYVKALEQKYLKLEDVYTTGIVAQLLNIKRIHVNEFINRRIEFNPCDIRKAISVHMIKTNEQFDLWKKLMDTTAKCK